MCSCPVLIAPYVAVILASTLATRLTMWASEMAVIMDRMVRRCRRVTWGGGGGGHGGNRCNTRSQYVALPSSVFDGCSYTSPAHMALSPTPLSLVRGYENQS